MDLIRRISFCKYRASIAFVFDFERLLSAAKTGPLQAARDGQDSRKLSPI